MSTAKSFELTAQKRSDVRKGASRRLRREGHVPAIAYGAGKDPMCINLSHTQLIKALENEAFYSHILTLDLEGEKEQVVLKDLQRHPYKKQILHADFLRIRPDQVITMRVPIHIVGADIAPGVKIGGGIVITRQKDIEIKCLPKDLPEFIDIDISKLELGHRLHLSHIKLPTGIELATDVRVPMHDLPIVSIQLIEEEVETTEEKPVETIITSAKVEEGAEGAEGKPAAEGAAKAPAKAEEAPAKTKK